MPGTADPLRTIRPSSGIDREKVPRWPPRRRYWEPALEGVCRWPSRRDSEDCSDLLGQQAASDAVGSSPGSGSTSFPGSGPPGPIGPGPSDVATHSRAMLSAPWRGWWARTSSVDPFICSVAVTLCFAGKLARRRDLLLARRDASLQDVDTRRARSAQYFRLSLGSRCAGGKTPAQGRVGLPERHRPMSTSSMFLPRPLPPPWKSPTGFGHRAKDDREVSPVSQRLPPFVRYSVLAQSA